MKRKGLAAAVWLLGVAGLWWLLPPAPRYVFTVPSGWSPLGVTGDGLLVAGAADQLAGWELATGHQRWLVDGLRHPNHTRFDLPTERLVVSPAITLDARTGLPTAPSTEDGRRRRAVASADGRYVASHQVGSDLMTVTETATGTDLYRWPVPLVAVPVAVSPDGRRVLTETGTLWAADRGERVWLHHREDGMLVPTAPVLMTADGRWLVAVRGSVVRGSAVTTSELCWLDTATGTEAVERRRSLDDPAIAVGVWPARQRFTGDRAADGLICVNQRWGLQPGWVGRLAVWLPFLHRLRSPAGDRLWLVDADVGAIVAELPANWSFERLLDDGRLAASGPHDRYAVWDIPPRPSRRLFAALAAGWGLLVLVVARWRRRRAVVSSVTPS